MILFPRLERHPFFSENIYSWVEKEMSETSEDNSLRYRSKFSSAVKGQLDSAKSTIPRTMGYAQASLKSPQDYLRKHARDTRTEQNKSIPCLCRKRHVSNDKRDGTIDKTIDTVRELVNNYERNFVAENALVVQKRSASVPARRRIDSRKGDSFDLENSSLIPKYCHKEDYGKVPSYIGKIRQNVKESREEFGKYITAGGRHAKPQMLPDETKKDILEGLVKNLKKLLKIYLTLPLMIETPLQIARKREIEGRIDSLQRDIDLMQRNKKILIESSSIPSGEHSE